MREIPEGLTQEERKHFKAIAERAACEAVNCYTVLSLGCQAYEEKERIGQSVSTTQASSPNVASNE